MGHFCLSSWVELRVSKSCFKVTCWVFYLFFFAMSAFLKPVCLGKFFHLLKNQAPPPRPVNNLRIRTPSTHPKRELFRPRIWCIFFGRLFATRLFLTFTGAPLASAGLSPAQAVELRYDHLRSSPLSGLSNASWGGGGAGDLFKAQISKFFRF